MKDARNRSRRWRLHGGWVLAGDGERQWPFVVVLGTKKLVTEKKTYCIGERRWRVVRGERRWRVVRGERRWQVVLGGRRWEENG
jgi:hypothetical protein